MAAPRPSFVHPMETILPTYMMKSPFIVIVKLKFRDDTALVKYQMLLKEQISFYKFAQFIFEKEWSKNWTKEEFKQIWQSGEYRKYCKKRKDTNEMVSYYIDKYGEEIPEKLNLVRTTEKTERRNTLGNSWHPLDEYGRASKLFLRNSRNSEIIFILESCCIKNKRGIHLEETSMYEEEWIINPSDIFTDFIDRRNY